MAIAFGPFGASPKTQGLGSGLVWTANLLVYAIPIYIN